VAANGLAVLQTKLLKHRLRGGVHAPRSGLPNRGAAAATGAALAAAGALAAAAGVGVTDRRASAATAGETDRE